MGGIAGNIKQIQQDPAQSDERLFPINQHCGKLLEALAAAKITPIDVDTDKLLRNQALLQTQQGEINTALSTLGNITEFLRRC